MRSAHDAATAGCLRRAVVAGARRLAQERLVVGTTGNVSVRSAETMWITPSRRAYADLYAEQIVGVDIGTGAALGPGTPSTELPMHLAVYRARPDTAAVVHTHSPHATAWSFLGRPLPALTEDLGYYGLGAIDTCSGGAPGSETLAAAVVNGLGQTGGALLLAGHGTVAIADVLELALDRALAIEYVAHVAWLLLGSGCHQPAVDLVQGGAAHRALR
jgi:L-fuculose-phosphate aldolase